MEKFINGFQIVSINFTDGAFKEWYQKNENKFCERLNSFCEMLKDALNDEFDAPFLERITVQSGRVKRTNRAWIKINEKNYVISELDEVPKHLKDILGTRIICTNIADLERIRDFLDSLPIVDWGENLNNGLSVLESTKKDYVTNVKETGYRAVHVGLAHRFPNYAGSEFSTCEVQARTLLQDAWGELTHEDTYKPGTQVPKVVTMISRQMSDLLATLDNMAQTLADELSVFEHTEISTEETDATVRKDPHKLQSISARDEFVKTQAVEQLRKIVESLEKPTSIANVAFKLQKELGTSFDGSWFGFDSFKQLLLHAVPKVEIEARPPGLVIPENYSGLVSYQHSGSGLPDGVPEIAGKLKQVDKSLPILSKEDFQKIYRYLHSAMRSLSNSTDSGIPYINRVTKRARDALDTDGVRHVSRAALDYVMKALLFAGSLEDYSTSEKIGLSYCDSTISRARLLLKDISTEDVNEIREWLSPCVEN